MKEDEKDGLSCGIPVAAMVLVVVAKRYPVVRLHRFRCPPRGTPLLDDDRKASAQFDGSPIIGRRQILLPTTLDGRMELD